MKLLKKKFFNRVGLALSLSAMIASGSLLAVSCKTCPAPKPCADKPVCNTSNCPEPGNSCQDCPGTSHSFMRFRGVTTDQTLTNSLMVYHRHHNNYTERTYEKPEHRSLFTYESTYFYQATSRANKLAEYFLPNRQERVSMLESGGTDANGNESLGSLWFGLISGDRNERYSSIIQIRPRRKQYGYLLGLNWDLACLYDGLWLSMNLAALSVKHKLNFQEYRDESAGACGGVREQQLEGSQGALSNPRIARAFDAFTNPLWNKGQFYSDELSKSGFDDILVRLGYDICYTDTRRLGIFGILVVPFGDRPEGNHFFEPTIGNGNHVGLGAGVNGEYQICDWYDEKFSVLTELRYWYLLSGNECRAVDLCNGDWTRYLLLVNKGLESVTYPGINELTRDLRIKPGHQVDWWTALHWQHCQYNFEMGYNLWYRSRERVSNAKGCDFKRDCEGETPGVFDLCFPCGSDPLTRTENGLISDGRDCCVPGSADTDAQGNRIFRGLTEADLNYDSARQPTTLTHKIYAGVSYDCALWNQPTLVGFGGAYEFRGSKGSADQWSVWGKFSLSYGGCPSSAFICETKPRPKKAVTKKNGKGRKPRALRRKKKACATCPVEK